MKSDKMDYSKLSDFEINLLVVQQRIKYGHFTTDQKDTSGKPYTSGGWDWGKGTGMGLFDRNGAEHVRHENGRKLDYCNNPTDAWPIIEKHGITLAFDGSDWWATSDAHWVDGCEWQIHGEINSKPFRAAMICYLMMQENK